MDYTDVMFDLEFLSLKSNPVVVSIGAVVWDMDDASYNPQEYYMICDLQEQLDRGRTVDENTLRWWMSQRDEVRDVLVDKREVCSYTLPFILKGISDWYNRAGGNQQIQRVWSHGAACDMAILKNLYDDYQLACPWHYRKVRDTKTAFDILKILDTETENTYDTMIGMWLRPDGVTAHHALQDAKNQGYAVFQTWHYLEAVLKRVGNA